MNPHTLKSICSKFLLFLNRSERAVAHSGFFELCLLPIGLKQSSRVCIFKESLLMVLHKIVAPLLLILFHPRKRTSKLNPRWLSTFLQRTSTPRHEMLFLRSDKILSLSWCFNPTARIFKVKSLILFMSRKSSDIL